MILRHVGYNKSLHEHVNKINDGLAENSWGIRDDEMAFQFVETHPLYNTDFTYLLDWNSDLSAWQLYIVE